MNQTTTEPMMGSAASNLAVHALASTATAELEWDAFVAGAADATFCHLSGWRRIFEEEMGHEATYLVARREDDSIAGVLPLVRLRSLFFGERLVSVPYLNDGGALGDAAAVTVLVDHALELARRGGGKLELRSRVGVAGLQSSCRKVTVLLDLPSEPRALWSALPSKVRSQVKRPQKAGMTVRFGTAELPAFYDVWSQNMRDLGTPVLPRKFFESVARAFPERFVVGCVYRDDVPVAAGAGFDFNSEFEITWASSLRAHNRDAPNMLLYWGFMEQVIERGARVFNFGRCTPGEGTHRFKLQWGGETVPLAWLVAPEGAAEDAGPGRAARVASTVWQRMPLGLANALGPTVARQLPWW